MKPMLAEDYVEDKLRFPLIAEPKIDGVRALNMVGKLTGRSLKAFGNRYVTARFSHSALIGLDGEMAANHECHPDLCRITTSALSTHEGEPYVLWHLFDLVTADTRDLPYSTRLSLLHQRVAEIQRDYPELGQHLRLVSWAQVAGIDELLELDAGWLDAGYEGTIIRHPNLTHKQGRSTVREGGLLRIKRFVDFEATVVQVEEGEHNGNVATINQLGHTERSTHQENMVPNGMVGALLCDVLADVKDKDKVLFQAGQRVRIAAGRMPHADRTHYWQNQNLILGRVVKGKLFPKGIKDKPRFPTFQSFRDPVDMGGE